MTIPEPDPEGASDLSNELQSQSNISRAVASPGPRVRRGFVEFAGDRHALVAALIQRNEGAAAALFHEYAPLVERTIGRILGVDDELSDATQEVFLRALSSIHKLRDPQALTDWLLQITVFTATDWIRRRKRRRWLVFFDKGHDDVQMESSADDTSREALRATYQLLDRLSVEERTVFALRYIDGMELSQVALACDCSLATIKRRLSRASARFEAMAEREPSLRPWVDAQVDKRRDTKPSREATS